MKGRSSKNRRIGTAKLVLLAAVIVVAGVAYRFSDYGKTRTLPLISLQREQSVADPAMGDAPEAQQPVDDPYGGWRDNVTTSQGFSFKYPSGAQWTVSQSENTALENGRIYTSSVAFDEDASEKGVVNVFELVVAKKGS